MMVRMSDAQGASEAARLLSRARWGDSKLRAAVGVVVERAADLDVRLRLRPDDPRQALRKGMQGDGQQRISGRFCPGESVGDGTGAGGPGAAGRGGGEAGGAGAAGAAGRVRPPGRADGGDSPAAGP